MLRHSLPLFAVLTGLIGCGSEASLDAAQDGALSDDALTASLPGQVTIAGNKLLRDGVVWAPHGFTSIAFVAPPDVAQGIFLAASNNYSNAEWPALRAWGADTVRIQISRPGIDPAGALFSAAFLKNVVTSVRHARAIGLNVIVSIQDEPQSGEVSPTPYPDAVTRRVWQNLAPYFVHDHGILFEIMNEPQPMPSDAAWAMWKSTMNAAIATIRAAGAHNVVVADGLGTGITLEGAPTLTDSDKQVVYSAHPYLHAAKDQTQALWDRKFGNMAAAVPVIITEWTTVQVYYCDANTPTSALKFLQYLSARGIGITAFAYDFGKPMSGSAVIDFAGTPSTFANKACGDMNFGPGKLLQQWYKTGTPPTSLK